MLPIGNSFSKESICIYSLESEMEVLSPIHFSETENEEPVVQNTATPEIISDVTETPLPEVRWSARRRPKVNAPLGAVDEAKIAVLEAQKEILVQEKCYREILLKMEVQHKKNIYKIELAKCTCKKNTFYYKDVDVVCGTALDQITLHLQHFWDAVNKYISDSDTSSSYKEESKAVEQNRDDSETTEKNKKHY
ncbi:hypothetical protein FQA39_LY12662 [Lamprigera yunnana]|nr:hypothetical protein FQA39_LY12662 [Lamprigera yunnana]